MGYGGYESNNSSTGSVEFTHAISNGSGDGGASSASAADGGTGKDKHAARDYSHKSLGGASNESHKRSLGLVSAGLGARAQTGESARVKRTQKAAVKRNADVQQAAVDPKAPISLTLW